MGSSTLNVEPHARLAFYPNASVLGFGERFGDGQAHARVAHALDQDVIGAVQAGENSRNVFRRDASARVGHLQQDVFSLVLGAGPDLEGDRAFVGRDRARVLQQVDQDLLLAPPGPRE